MLLDTYLKFLKSDLKNKNDNMVGIIIPHDHKDVHVQILEACEYIKHQRGFGPKTGLGNLLVVPWEGEKVTVFDHTKGFRSD